MEAKEIRLKVHGEDDLFSELDPDKSILSEDVISIFMRNYIHKHRRLKEKYRIHIITDTPVNEENVKEKIRAYLIQERDDIDYAIRRVTAKELLLAALGTIFLILWIYLSEKMNPVRAEMLTIVGWVGIWEATDIFIMERPELFRVRFNLNNLIKSEIVITTN